MFSFVWWWAFVFLPLPFIILRFTPAHESHQVVRLPFIPKGAGNIQVSQTSVKALALFAWLCAVTALARPVWLGDPVSYHPKHRDLMLVVDLSYSMSQEDMKLNGDYIDRLTAVKQVLSDFIELRQGDRVGLVLFADHAYLQTPLTLDRSTVIAQLQRTVLKLIGTNTAIGEGIGLATKTFVDSDAPQRVMVLLSDGSNTAGVIDPIEAAQIAKKYNATIYTVGVGAGEMVVSDFLFERKVNTAHDLDEETLKQIASITGGQYFRARDAKELQNIYQTIDELEPVTGATQTWRPQTEWFGVPLALYLVSSLVLVWLRRQNG
ncbi:VWA domain-containing protein [Vibrio sp. SCSIO 43136]|uniref:vWA domain-containing protein n=1 Tax=Vibrio sp. SCSIO 43136 TaxID=2819101 RepID=UPI00207646BC|nr:VWA domain-containing protein [Vibrio sp. SCSIO 43136]USD67164.1 VWA domain-containing protein [Vibrio sp. SCSIO 43136]